MCTGGAEEDKEKDRQFMDGTKGYIAKQQRWLLFLRHCARCEADKDCPYGNSCIVAKALWRHIMACNDQGCPYPRYSSIFPLQKRKL